MPLLPRKGSLPSPPSSTSRSMRAGGRSRPKRWRRATRLPPRHLEPVLQALVRHGILEGIRGPRGGYELARERGRITADDILRAAGTADELDGAELAESQLLSEVVMPALVQAEKAPSRQRWRASTSRTWRTAPKACEDPATRRADLLRPRQGYLRPGTYTVRGRHRSYAGANSSRTCMDDDFSHRHGRACPGHPRL